MTYVRRWGNSLALRIPKPLAEEVGLGEGALVELSLVEGRLVITPIARSGFRLEDLLAQVTEENLHREVGTGLAMGDEAW